MINNIEKFYLDKPEPNRSCLLVLREIILSFSENISETRKYNMPCFCLSKKPFCYLWIDKKVGYPYILFVKGNDIDHPQLIQGDRKKMKILPINPNEDIPIKTINEIFNIALNFYQN